MPWTSSKKDIYQAYKDVHQKYEKVLNEKHYTQANRDKVIKQKFDLEGKVSGLTPDSLVESISKMKKAVSKTLDELMTNINFESEKLQNIKKLQDLEAQQLEEIKDKNTVQMAIETLVQEYEDKKEQLEDSFIKREKQLEETILFKESEWAEKKAALERENKEFTEEMMRKRKRDEDDYEYQLQQRKQKDEDELNQKRFELERELSEKKEAFENELKTRENEILLTENELKNLREEKKLFDKKLQEALEQQKADLTERLTLKYEHEIALIRQSKDALEENLKSQILSLKDYMLKQESQIEKLNEKLEYSTQKVQDIANKAIEGASGTTTLGAINKLAMEQAKGVRASSQDSNQ